MNAGESRSYEKTADLMFIKELEERSGVYQEGIASIRQRHGAEGSFHSSARVTAELEYGFSHVQYLYKKHMQIDMELTKKAKERIDEEDATWIFGRVQEIIKAHMESIERSTAAPRGMDNYIHEECQRKKDEFLASAKRDLMIEIGLQEIIPPEARADGLTKLLNREAFDVDIKKQLANSSELQQPLSLVFSDIDGFKRFNDQYGHQTGDDALKKVAQLLCKCVLGKGKAYRYGGEELIAILPNATSEEAMATCERFRKLVEQITLERVKDKITISIGIATSPPGSSDPAKLIKAADNALYQAKDKGKIAALSRQSVSYSLLSYRQKVKFEGRRPLPALFFLLNKRELSGIRRDFSKRLLLVSSLLTESSPEPEITLETRPRGR